jgi:hypothetical protein
MNDTSVPSTEPIAVTAMQFTAFDGPPGPAPKYPDEYPVELKKRLPIPPVDRESFVLRLESLRSHHIHLENLLVKYTSAVQGLYEAVPREKIVLRAKQTHDRLLWMEAFLREDDRARAS